MSQSVFDIRPSLASERIYRLRVIGELDTAAAPGLISSLRQAGDRVTRVHLDLSGVTFIDCSGLTALLTAVRNARRSGREIQVDENVSLAVRRIIEMAGVSRLVWPEPSAQDHTSQAATSAHT